MSGWKDWAIGEVVTESDFQSFVQDQVVQVYDDSTDRDNTLGTAVAEGMVAYLKDTDSTIVYDGTAWIAVGAGDITGVTAGTALTGGGVSGDVTLDVDISALATAHAGNALNANGELLDVDESAITLAQSQVTNLVTDLGNKQDDVITTQGDLVTGDASGDPVRLGIGTADQVLTSDGTALTWADSSGGLPIGTAGYTALSNGTAGLSYQPVSHNYIINGAFDIWQRGDSIDVISIDYSTDRFQYVTNSPPTNVTIDKRDFTPDELNANGFGDAKSHLRINMTDVGSMTIMNIGTKIEDVQTLAGQTVTVSFWAKADSNRTLTSGILRQNFGSGGSSNVNTNLPNIDLTTSWQRFTSTVTLPSISGKTIGSGSYLQLRYNLPVATGAVIDLWGVQLEAGSIATPFKRNANSIQGELAACQRYYQRIQATATGQRFGVSQNVSSSLAQAVIPFPTKMRVAPSALEQSGTASDYSIFTGASFLIADSVPSFIIASEENIVVEFSKSNSLTTGQASQLRVANANAFLGWSAEL